MIISAVIHILFSEDYFYIKKGCYLKFLHNTLINSFVTIYHDNYQQMDDTPVRVKNNDEEIGEET